jgi:prepilin-type N-terminal cleavage/methylation domain-containing protein
MPVALRPAFTLVELMVALLILAVGVALVHGIGGSVVDRSRGQETRAIQQVLRQATLAYGQAEAGYPTASGGDASSAVLYEHLRRCSRCEPILRRLPRLATYEDTRGRVHILDAFGSPMRYYHGEGELAGRPPMILSHGADRDDLSDDIVTDLN